MLERHIAEKIAAGEVVERPASVVKELVENSLDAHASRIVVEVVDGGRKSITVRDDGEGMTREDAVLAFARYSTSKISHEEDLSRVRTYGFRGEALHSIGAVAKVEMITRARGEETGTRVVVEGGEIRAVEEVGAPVGTAVTVRDLFFNVPARRKFMKSAAAEERRISSLLTAVMLARPDVHFVYRVNGRERVNAPPGSVRDRIAYLLGAEVARECKSVHLSTGRITVTGCIASPSACTRSGAHIHVFVNGRVVEDSGLRAAVLEGYGTLLPRDMYPVAVLNVVLPPEDVDVNVHPRKMEVVFRDPRAVYSTVRRAVAQTLEVERLVPDIRPAAEKPAAGYLEVKAPRQSRFEVVEGRKGEGKTMRIEDALKSLRLPVMRVVGQVLNTYIVAEGEGSLFLVDQHAAHERIRYERFMKSVERRGSQKLVEPAVVHLTPGEISALRENREFIASLGYDVQELGGTSVMVRAVPPTLEGADAIEGLREGLMHLREGRKDEAMKSVACKGAIKAGDALGEEEMRKLLRELAECENPFTCPHGRPTIVRIDKREIERMFRRGV